MPKDLQGFIVFVAGLLVAIGGGVGSIAILSGAAEGDPGPHYLTLFGIGLTLIGLRGWKGGKQTWNAIPVAGIWTVLALLTTILVLNFA